MSSGADAQDESLRLALWALNPGVRATLSLDTPPEAQNLGRITLGQVFEAPSPGAEMTLVLNAVDNKGKLPAVRALHRIVNYPLQFGTKTFHAAVNVCLDATQTLSDPGHTVPNGGELTIVKFVQEVIIQKTDQKIKHVRGARLYRRRRLCQPPMLECIARFGKAIKSSLVMLADIDTYDIRKSADRFYNGGTLEIALLVPLLISLSRVFYCQAPMFNLETCLE